VSCRFKKLRISIATLKHPRWVKLGTLFYNTVDTLKQTFISIARTQRENFKRNITGLPPAKRFLYSYIARLFIPLVGAMMLYEVILLDFPLIIIRKRKK
jgi:hypothetical protein